MPTSAIPLNFQEFAMQAKFAEFPLPEVLGQPSPSLALLTKKRVSVSPDKLPIILLGGFDDTLLGGTPRAEARHERAVLAAQDNYVRVRLLEVVVALGKPEPFPLAPALATKKGAPPGAWGSDLLQVLRPEQPLPAVREAHVHHHVRFSPVTTHHLADQASALLYPVVL